MRALELLAPAKNLECGIAAIEHGADAVYIGANHFGARMAAGNTVEDIAALTVYAHRFGVKVYVTVNTIVYEDEIEDSHILIEKLANIHVDGILIQDMGLLGECKNAGISIHASTQCDTRTAEKVFWLHSLGFRRVVLARELSLKEIHNIHRTVPDVELEVFIHGALCVSYSGICYASQYCFGRSANRGECAQFCRLKFDLKDASGKMIEQQRHFLSMKDMCQIDYLEELAAAGACSFKIEGRLKDAGYVKNVVAAYSKRLNDIVRRHPQDYCRASKGEVKYYFEPHLEKTFNRGFTNYFLKGRQLDISSFDTPKALGEYVGKIKEIRHDSFTVAGTAIFANGDGLCFINEVHELEGFRVNRVVDNRLFPFHMPAHIHPGLPLYRNHDVEFEKILSGHSAERKLDITMRFSVTGEKFKLLVVEKSNEKVSGMAEVLFKHQIAEKPQRDNIIKQLTKLGNTIYRCAEVEIEEGTDRFFIPSSILADLRRNAIDNLATHTSIVKQKEPKETSDVEITSQKKDLIWQPEYKAFPYLYNISNHVAREFYVQQQLPDIQEAFEVNGKRKEPVIMQCCYCLRYALGYCEKKGGKHPFWHEPLKLELSDGKTFRLEFKCSECQMNIYAEK